MSKYEKLWQHIQQLNQDTLMMTFAEIKEILGFKVDHAFLTYKKELIHYGYQVLKISLKNETIIFKRGH